MEGIELGIVLLISWLFLVAVFVSAIGIADLLSIIFGDTRDERRR